MRFSKCRRPFSFLYIFFSLFSSFSFSIFFFRWLNLFFFWFVCSCSALVNRIFFEYFYHAWRMATRENSCNNNKCSRKSKQIDFWCLFGESLSERGRKDTLSHFAVLLLLLILLYVCVCVCMKVSAINSNPLSWQCFILMRYLPFDGNDIMILLL